MGGWWVDGGVTGAAGGVGWVGAGGTACTSGGACGDACRWCLLSTPPNMWLAISLPLPGCPPPQAVYHMPTSEDSDPASSMPLALQSVFYKVGVAAAAAVRQRGEQQWWRRRWRP